MTKNESAIFKDLCEVKKDKNILLTTIKNILIHLHKDKTINEFTFLQVDEIINEGLSKLSAK